MGCVPRPITYVDNKVTSFSKRLFLEKWSLWCKFSNWPESMKSQDKFLPEKLAQLIFQCCVLLDWFCFDFVPGLPRTEFRKWLGIPNRDEIGTSVRDKFWPNPTLEILINCRETDIQNQSKCSPSNPLR